MDRRETSRLIDADGDALFQTLIGTAVDGIIVIDERGDIQVYNPSCERLFGYRSDEVLGRNVKILMPAPYHSEHDDYLSRYRDTRERHIIGIGREVVGRRNDGSTFPMYLSVGEGRLKDRPVFVGIVHDRSDRHLRESHIQDLQHELQHVMRMTAMGQMSSALAHELYQPLTANLSYTNAAAKMALALGGEANELCEVLDRAAEQTMRAGDILGRLRAFVEKRERHCESEDLNTLIHDAVRLGLVDAHDAGIELKIEPDPDMPRVTVDKIEIQQVLVNLMRNATEAMMESQRRELTISTDQTDPGYLTVTVADTGPGLSTEVARRLFEPFVSTKPNGMGMGLNICRTIVQAHGGRLWSDPNPGGGTIFRFRLPVDGGMGARCA